MTKKKKVILNNEDLTNKFISVNAELKALKLGLREWKILVEKRFWAVLFICAGLLVIDFLILGLVNASG